MAKQRNFLQARSGTRPFALPEPGEILIDGYRVEALVGVGPLTAVYRAVLESHQQAVVLKVLLPHLADSEMLVQRFLQSANAARMVNHDRVLPCYDVGQSHGWVYQACEYVEGDTLDLLMEHGAMDRTRAVHLSWQIAMGLESIHGAGLVHGNLRPSNVLIDAEDVVRLADLGLPALPDGQMGAAPILPAGLHLPPEAMLGDVQADERGDIYAVGVILLGCLMGRTPREGLSRSGLLELHAGRVPVLEEAPADLLDPGLAAVIARATAIHPGERYADTWKLREDLERLQYQFSPIHALAIDGPETVAPRDPAVRSTASVPALGGRRRSRLPSWRWIGLAAVVALVVLIGAARFGTARPPESAPPPPVSPVPSPVAAAPVAPALAAPPAVAAAVSEPIVGRPSWAASGGQDAHGRWVGMTCSGVTQRFRLLPPGSFYMGSPPDEADRSADEDRHLVTLTRGFWIAETEVTQAFYAAVSGNPSPAHFSDPSRPVESISWYAVQDFLARLGGTSGAAVRLPSEAEWEYACRGGMSPAGASQDQAWTSESGVDRTQVVARLPPNACGLFDMRGNVLEWVGDTYGRYHRESSEDPLATGGVHRVTRGGSWNLSVAAARPAARSKALPVSALFYLGFRIAISDAGR